MTIHSNSKPTRSRTTNNNHVMEIPDSLINIAVDSFLIQFHTEEVREIKLANRNLANTIIIKAKGNLR